MKRLYKSEKNKMICGVCGGIADYFNIDPTIIRLIMVALILFGFGTGIIIYIIAAIVMPFGSNQKDDSDIENMKRAKSADDDSDKNKSKTPHSDKEFDEYFKK